MKSFNLQGIELGVPARSAFEYISDPANLPQWTNAFDSVSEGRAMMHTPSGEAEIGLEVIKSEENGTIDWIMTFPDGAIAKAYSRLTPLDPRTSAFSFILPSPPEALSDLEGELKSQSEVLKHELQALKSILENHG